MQVYLVGGYVRDRLLAQQGHSVVPGDRDWVVVGATPEMMTQRGFKPVGKDFPVFLHPQTHEEYALARTERKIARGYHGFEMYTSPEVTLEEDLRRRDLTINAIAMTEQGQIIDPYHGQDDLQSAQLRHVSDAFIEDPVRILRVARFCAKFPHFHIAPETLHLMQEMVQSGEADALVPERIWAELKKGLQQAHPSAMVSALLACGLWEKLFPGLDASGPTLEGLCRYIPYEMLPLEARVALLFVASPSLEALDNYVGAIRIPSKESDFAHLFWKLWHTPPAYKVEDLSDYFQRTDVLRKPERFDALITLAKGLSSSSFFSQLHEAARSWKSIDIAAVRARTSPDQMGLAIIEERKRALSHFLSRPTSESH